MVNQLKTIALLGGLSALLIGLGSLIGTGAMLLFGVLAIAMNIGAYFYSDRIVLRMQRAQPIERRQAPKLHAMVDELARSAEIPVPRLYLVDDPQPNAFATGRNPEHGVVAVTSGILQHLDERELRGVIAHEIAHIKNRDILIATVAAGIASAVTFIANALQFTAFFGGLGGDDDEHGSPFGALIVALIAPIGATLIQMAISRSREFEADATGARISGDPEGLARALERLQRGSKRIPSHAEPAGASLYIANPLQGRSMASLFSTHPDMGQRIQKLRAMNSSGPVRIRRVG